MSNKVFKESCFLNNESKIVVKKLEHMGCDPDLAVALLLAINHDSVFELEDDQE